MIRLVILAAAMAHVALPAHASQTLPYTFVQCLGEEVMVRFEFGSGLAPLTQPEAGRWKNVPAVSGAQGCKLASGAAAIVLQGDQQTTNGSGGADPPGFLSFWVGGKKLISREIYKGGYGSFGLTHNSIHYSPGSLTRCTYPQATDAYTDISKVICKAESLDITGLPADPLAPTAEMIARFGTFSVLSTSNEAFCKSFVRPVSYAGEEPRDPGILYTAAIGETRELLAAPSGTQFPMSASGRDADDPFSSPGEWVPNASAAFKYQIAQFDYTNTGQPQTVLRLWGGDLTFMGDIYLHWTGVAPQSAIDAVLKALPWTYKWREFLRDGPWASAFSVPEDQFPRIYGMPMRIAGVTYFYWRNYTVEAAPSARLYRMTPKAPELICTFQQLQPAF